MSLGLCECHPTLRSLRLEMSVCLAPPPALTVTRCWQLAGEKKERGPQTVSEESIYFANDATSGSMEVGERALMPVVLDKGCPAHFIVPELPLGLQSKEVVLLY